jgi:hypothetical protein
LVVNGRGRGLIATLIRIHEDSYNCDIRFGADILGGPAAAMSTADTAIIFSLLADREICGVEYEDICKLADV